MTFDAAFESIASAQELSIETLANDRTYATVIWVVAVDGTLYVRSFLGHEAKWYQRVVADPRAALRVGSDRLEFTAARVTDPDVIDAVSRAFVEKYPQGRSRDAMIRAEVLDTTLMLEPRLVR